MTRKELPPVDLLRKLLRYEPETGKLFWRERHLNHFKSQRDMTSWNAKNAENEAFTSYDGHGYKRGAIFRRHYPAHRVAYAIYHGAWPEGDIDHINGVRNDNRIENIRCVSRSGNARNQKLRRNSKTGNVGVHWYNRLGRWVARATIDGHCRHIGTYGCKTAAIVARRAFEQKNGFHENHGRVVND